MTEWAETARVGGDEGRVYSALSSTNTQAVLYKSYIHTHIYFIFDISDKSFNIAEVSANYLCTRTGFYENVFFLNTFIDFIT